MQVVPPPLFSGQLYDYNRTCRFAPPSVLCCPLGGGSGIIGEAKNLYILLKRLAEVRLYCVGQTVAAD